MKFVLKIIIIIFILCVILQIIQLSLPFNKRVQIINGVPKLLSNKYFNPTRITDGKKTLYFFRDFDPVVNSLIGSSSKVIMVDKDNSTTETEISFNNSTKHGYEDPRSIIYNDNIYLFLSAINSQTKIVEMFIAKYKPKQKLDALKIYPFADKGHKKNFMPFISKDKLYFIFSTAPQYVIMEMETKNGEITGKVNEILRKSVSTFQNVKGKGKISLKKDYLKGNTKGCLYGNYIYFVVHKTFIDKSSVVKYYVNHLLVIEKDYPFDIVALSQPFILTDSEIILADLYNPLIMFINFGIRNINFITDMEIYPDGVVEILYGYRDQESYSVKCKLSDIISFEKTVR